MENEPVNLTPGKLMRYSLADLWEVLGVGEDYLPDDYRLMNAINDAISTPHILSETQPRCPTGNCTWPLFVSLGFCYNCENVTLYMQDKSNSTDYQGPKGLETGPYRNWTYTLPDMVGQVLTTGNERHSFNVTSALFTGTGIPVVESFYGLSLDWTSMTALNFTNGASIPAVTLNLLMQVSTQSPDFGAISSAYVCALSFCAHRCNVSMSLNQLSSTILQTAYGTPVWAGTDRPGKDIWLDYIGDNISVTYPSNVMSVDALDVTSAVWENGLGSLAQAFTGNVTVPLNWTAGNESRITYSSSTTSTTLAALNDSPNISMAMNNVAIAMTNYFRDSSNTTVIGQAGQSKIYIRVRWPWITLSALLVAAGTAFLLLAMLETKRRGARVWKTSELALLFPGLGTSEQEFATVNKESEMERMAEGMRVRMTGAGGGGWTLRQEKAPIEVT